MSLRTAAIVLSVALGAAAWAAPPLPLQDPMRGPTPVAEETDPPLMSPVENKDIRRVRTYSMQPPTIPHKIDGYQIDKNFNRCLACHARVNTEETQAPPLSVTHYMDRDSNVLAEVSPRRYFCVQCHVPQAEARPLVSNTFQDIDVILKRLTAPKPDQK
ncbi:MULTISPECIES: nitrate reductase cytochrome c-type subunit [Bordetella]|uniref:Periplasmic nitrate reductase, electron transfer subunit n=1 Tax=Bordetella genomosp. 6 TaxID=463024 RepID=A0ABX4FIX8_9BORD|nr:MULTISPECIES: nitrate reductase cytochrome c-type subunit [Bordetella]AOB26862.1 nitrate reductase [Bordetella bronchiseptica]AZW44174.1 nitrate reductase cytochrome c-type subunit; periplasmic nitrate reductase electron transfer subunit [Bordetella bronchiseptica]KCV67087.1 periplasmic nitrate reductase, diheme cytochrome c subunit [Bordetella bronchiseptica 99-R-0433]MBN3269594.1 nitrate reductase cytochrome c-type subunit; periplasmic nitrate reductase electron transfer subunit [Bordetell